MVASRPAVQCSISFENPCRPSPAITGLALRVAHRQVDVAAVALALVELGHEGQRLAVLVGDLLRAVLVDRVVVAGGERLGVLEGDLLLAEVALALDALAVHAGALHAEADVAQQRLHAGGGEQGVVDVVVGRRGEAACSPSPRPRGSVSSKTMNSSSVPTNAVSPRLLEAGQLGAQDLARALDERLVARARSGRPSPSPCRAATG